MKKCPKCQVDYFDQMLEFCVEDGAKLIPVSAKTTAVVAETKPLFTDQKSIETAFFPGGKANIPDTVEINDSPTANKETDVQPSSLKQKAVEKGYRALEVGTLVFALAHNWLQWLYIERQNYGSVANFLTSAEVLIWFLLLFAGTAFGLLALKLSRTKALAYIGLLILAINFLLMLVPRK